MEKNDLEKKIVQPSFVNDFVYIGEGTKIWAFCNIYGSKEDPVSIGDNTQIGGYTEIKPGSKIGDNCRLQSYIFVPEGISIHDNVFIGPRVTFTNDKYPDIAKTLAQKWDRLDAVVGSYVSIGAGVVINPGIKIGKYAQIGAGAIVTKNVDEYAVMVGNPAKKVGDIRDDKFKDHYRKLLKYDIRNEIKSK